MFKILLILFYAFSMLCIGMRKFLLSFFLLFVMVPVRAEWFEYCESVDEPANCLAGCKWNSQAGCVSCPDGEYTSSAGQTTCSSCNKDAYQNAIWQGWKSPGKDANSCAAYVTCNTGMYWNGTKCTKCNSGHALKDEFANKQYETDITYSEAEHCTACNFGANIAQTKCKNRVVYKNGSNTHTQDYEVGKSFYITPTADKSTNSEAVPSKITDWAKAITEGYYLVWTCKYGTTNANSPCNSNDDPIRNKVTKYSAEFTEDVISKSANGAYIELTSLSQACPRDSYCAFGDAVRPVKCPEPLTTVGIGATSASACGITRNNVFTDSKGSFKLPISGVLSEIK